MICQHCGRETKSRQGNLCRGCYYRPDLRRKYEGDGDEMTEAELDAMIAEQMKNLPSWWNEVELDELPCMPRDPSPLCRHCKKWKARNGGTKRGLCGRCHSDLSIRKLYPARQRIENLKAAQS